MRERREDIPSLVWHFTRQFAARMKRNYASIAPETMAALCEYDWPGNIRELKNLVEAIFVELPQGEVTVADLPRQFQRRCACMDAVSQEEQDRLVGALLATNWNKSKAASRLRWSRMTLYRKMARYNIQRT